MPPCLSLAPSAVAGYDEPSSECNNSPSIRTVYNFEGSISHDASIISTFLRFAASAGRDSTCTADESAHYFAVMRVRSEMDQHRSENLQPCQYISDQSVFCGRFRLHAWGTARVCGFRR